MPIYIRYEVFLCEIEDLPLMLMGVRMRGDESDMCRSKLVLESREGAIYV